MLARLKKQIVGILNNYLTKKLDKQLVLQGQVLVDQYKRKTNIHDLSEVEFSVFSQWGEDGIINWLISMIPDIPKTFIEFGVGDYTESNTRFLLKTRNWKGLIIDGAKDDIDSVYKQDIYWRYDLTAVASFITKDNINELFLQNGFSGEIGLLSIDIDGNDYWVWEAIHSVDPVIVVCEYNAVFGDVHKLSVPYDKDFQRTNAHHSNLYFGASLPALISLASKKGYEFAGTTSTGLNAFFIRKDKFQYIQQCLNKVCSFPSLFREARGVDGELLFIGNKKRIKLINHLPVYDFDGGKNTVLSEYNDIYSTDWLRHLQM